MSFSLSYSEKFLDDLKKHKKSGQKQLLSKVERFVTECLENPKAGTGRPEQFKHRKIETWSREINKQHRLIYEIESDDILFLSAWGHYDDK